MIVPEEKLWQVEIAFESAFKQILNRDGIANAYISRSGLQMETPCVEVRFTPGSNTEKRRHIYKNDLTVYPPYSGWIGSLLEFTVKTNRGSETASQHTIYLGKIRKNCSIAHLLRPNVGTWYNTEASGYNGISDIRESGGESNSLDNDNDHDITIVRFSVMHNLIDAAFPNI